MSCCLESLLGIVIGFQFAGSNERSQQRVCLGLLNRADSGLFRRQIARVPWDSPEGHRSPGRLGVLQETNRKAQEHYKKDIEVLVHVQGMATKWLRFTRLLRSS